MAKLVKVLSHYQYQATHSGVGRDRNGVYRCTTVLKLECGHTANQKGSVPIPKRVRCRECR